MYNTRTQKSQKASSGLCSRGLLLTRQPLHWAELSRRLIDANNEIPIFKVSQPLTLKALGNPFKTRVPSLNEEN
jgi:hypothetical protein